MDQKRSQPVILQQTLWDRIRIRIVEVAVAVFLASVVIQVAAFIHKQRREAVLSTSWFRVNEIFVPDHVKGQNPQVVYDVEIFERFRGLKLTEVQRRDINDLMFTECSGVEVNEYIPGDVIPDRKVSWEWIVGRKCVVGPGSYRLRISYDLHRDGWPTKRLVALSNVFTVREPDAAN